MRIRLHDAIDAIAELCKLDGLYKGKKVEVNVAPTSVVVVGDVPSLGKRKQEKTSEKTSR